MTRQLTVNNTTFLLDKLADECGEKQFLRELTQNAIEAILETPTKTGTISWLITQEYGAPKLSVVDNGKGMTGVELVLYINQLSSSSHIQDAQGNYGVGAKIAVLSTNKAGVIYQSWTDVGPGNMIWMWYDKANNTYGLKAFDDGSYVKEVTERPKEIITHGTRVVLLGNSMTEDTAQGEKGAYSGFLYYLSDRFAVLPEGIKLRAHTDFTNCRTVTPFTQLLNKNAADKGAVDLSGGRMYWWLIKKDYEKHWAGLHSSTGFIITDGKEAYTRLQPAAARHALQQAGIVLGYGLVVLAYQPARGTFKSDLARSQLLVNGKAIDASVIAEQFKQKLPKVLKDHVEEVSKRISARDYGNKMEDRVREYMEFPHGAKNGTGTAVAIKQTGTVSSTASDSTDEPTEKKPRVRNKYSLSARPTKSPTNKAVEYFPKRTWVSIEDGTREADYLDNRAAAYIPSDNHLLINADFKLFAETVEYWMAKNNYGVELLPSVQAVIQGWFEQQLTETVIGAIKLCQTPGMTIADVEKFTTEEALTSSVVARYTLNCAIKYELQGKLGHGG